MSADPDPASHSATSSAIAPLPIPPEATEEQLIALWLHGKRPNTIRAYRRDIANSQAAWWKRNSAAVLQRIMMSMNGDQCSRKKRS